MSDFGSAFSASATHGVWSELEQARWDPKDGDLCLSRVKPGEILVEARSDPDVQIGRRIWV